MTLVMGVLNVTPDSFSDGGRWFDTEQAISHGRELARQGAAIVDVGGESTRPGAGRVEAAEESRRVIPVIRALVADGIPCSIDTMRATTARAAVEAGATIINDVSGGLADDAMLPTMAELGVDVILQHWRGHSQVMQELAHYRDAPAEVLDETLRRRDEALDRGVAAERIIIDPGLGFAKEAEHNWQILRDLARWQTTGHRVLVGASRKRFLRPTEHPDLATAMLTSWCAAHGIWGVRTHEIAMQLEAVRIGRELGHRG